MNSVTNSRTSTVELPPGVRHYKTTAFAETWHAYDMLHPEDEWEETAWYVDLTGSPCDPGTEGAKLHVQKTASIRGQDLVVFPPLGTRHEPEGGEHA